jgi:hypothetical protein
MDEYETTEHPSYGMIEIGRWQGGGQVLFGSSIEHHNTIHITILEGAYRRDLSHDWYYSRKPIVEVAMSQTQFAEAITNIGSGTPCTITYRTDKGKMPPVPFESKVKQFNDEFSKDMKGIASKCDDIIKEAEERKLPKAFVSKLQMLKQDLGSNMPFVNQSFTEQMESTVKEAKGEVEAFISHKVHSLGLEALRNELPTINEAKMLEKGEK